jgi:hypothetical protein
MCAKMREESLHLKTLFIVNTLTLKPSINPTPFGGMEFSLSKESSKHISSHVSMHIFKRDKRNECSKIKIIMQYTHAINKPGDKLDLYLSLSHAEISIGIGVVESVGFNTCNG